MLPLTQVGTRSCDYIIVSENPQLVLLGLKRREFAAILLRERRGPADDDETAWVRRDPYQPELLFHPLFVIRYVLDPINDLIDRVREFLTLLTVFAEELTGGGFELNKLIVVVR